MKKIKLKKGRFFLMLFVTTIVIYLINLALTVQISQLNYNVEQQKAENTELSRENEAVQMQINEALSLDNITAFATANGLTHNEENVLLVEGETDETK